jgi:hypothetical protein
MPNYEDKLKLTTTELWHLPWGERLDLLNPVKKDIKEIVLDAPSRDKKSTFDWPAFEAKVGLFSRLCTTLKFWLGGERPSLHPMAEVLDLIVYDKRCPEGWACDFLACFQRQGVNLFEQKRLSGTLLHIAIIEDRQHVVHYLLNQAIQANRRDWLEYEDDSGDTVLDCLNILLDSASSNSKEKQSLEGLKATIESYLVSWDKLRQPDYKPITNPNQQSLFNRVKQTLFGSPSSGESSESSGDAYSPRAKELPSHELMSSSDEECPNEPLLIKKNQ